jgi:hypothetical protein
MTIPLRLLAACGFLIALAGCESVLDPDVSCAQKISAAQGFPPVPMTQSDVEACSKH